MEPGISLIIGFAVLMILAIFFWPDKGIYSLWQKNKLRDKRVFIEDSLKYIYDCEYKGNFCSPNSIAGNLSISGDSVTDLLNQLQKKGLALTDGTKVSLTEKGRSYALRVIRVHRIWERYLADETGVSENDWHENADVKEHLLTFEEANKIAAKIGNPVFDPHGDPIPTESGNLPVNKGISMRKMKQGEIGLITHIEDEPRSIYSQLIAMKLYPGTKVFILGKDEEKLIFSANGEEDVLSLLFAENITIEPIINQKIKDKKYKALSSLKIGDEANIIGISFSLRGQQRRRLMDLGVVPGTKIKVVLTNPGGNMFAYNILGAKIALREEQTSQIFVQ